ncbi:MAG: carbon storage regulator [Armatimonadetes bacterium]|nr:carbon storage regulator [Armatimonadota bacterium]
MLILSRKPGQSIIIGGIIEITVAEVRGDQVRLGITAPRSVPIFRTEVLANQGGFPPNGPDPGDLLEVLSTCTDDSVLASSTDLSADPKEPGPQL